MSINIQFNPSDKILELGGGENGLKKRYPSMKVTNVDIRHADGVDVVRNLEEDFSDLGEYDGVYAQYVAEHISWRRIGVFFRSCFNCLKSGGNLILIIPNTKAQMELALSQKEFTFGASQMIFGDQNYGDNSHKVAFSPELIHKILKTVGFDKIAIQNHPDPKARDLIVVATKGIVTLQDGGYNRTYFDGGAYTGYRDFPVHNFTVQEILKRKPTSVVEFGGGRGYIGKHLRVFGVPCDSYDISTHCYMTRSYKGMHRLDLVKEDLPKIEYDLSFSTNFLEHIPEKDVPTVLSKIVKSSKRGLHGIHTNMGADDIDVTHLLGTMKPLDWWKSKFAEIDPSYQVELYDSTELEKNAVYPVMDDSKVKINIGSFTEMFHYGWENWDILDLEVFAKGNGYKFRRVDVTKPLLTMDSTVDCITAHHIVEHLTRDEAELFARECFRVLKPGGVVRFSTPDSLKLAKSYIDGTLITNFSPINGGVEGARDNADAYWNLSTSNHKTYHDENTLKQLFLNAGFKDVYVSEFDSSKSDSIRLETIDAQPEISVYVEAVKESLNQPVNDAIKKYLEG